MCKARSGNRRHRATCRDAVLPLPHVDATQPTRLPGTRNPITVLLPCIRTASQGETDYRCESGEKGQAIQLCLI